MDLVQRLLANHARKTRSLRRQISLMLTGALRTHRGFVDTTRESIVSCHRQIATLAAADLTLRD